MRKLSRDPRLAERRGSVEVLAGIQSVAMDEKDPVSYTCKQRDSAKELDSLLNQW